MLVNKRLPASFLLRLPTRSRRPPAPPSCKGYESTTTPWQIFSKAKDNDAITSEFARDYKTRQTTSQQSAEANDDLAYVNEDDRRRRRRRRRSWMIAKAPADCEHGQL